MISFIIQENNEKSKHHFGSFLRIFVTLAGIPFRPPEKEGIDMLYEAHRGVSAECPENTMAAFRAAAMQGYDMIELDPAFTKDGVCVVLHDKTLERTCRKADGTPIGKEVRIADITYAEAKKYDAGIAKELKFGGERIPRLAEVLSFAEGSGITVKLDNRAAYFPPEKQRTLFELVKSYTAKVVFTCPTVDFAVKVHALFPDAAIHYDGDVTEPILKLLKSAVGDAALTVWCPLRSEATGWACVPFADKAICEMIKKYASLGLWILTKEGQIAEAVSLGADIVETDGVCKKPRTLPGAVDTHTHTEHSHDSACRLDDSCREAVKNGLYGIAVTDHLDTWIWREINAVPAILASVADAKRANKAQQGKLRVFSGIEIGEGMWYPEAAERMTHLCDYDVVLGSVHVIKYRTPFSLYDFTNDTDEQIDTFLRHYFEDLAETAEKMDFDVLTHLTVPVRYIVGKYHKTVHMERYDAVIDHILSTIVRRHIALEINTSSYDAIGTLPSYTYVRRYRDMGGYLFTLCSDAHAAVNIGHRFDEVIAELKELGIKNLYYYEKRVPIPYTI